MANTDGRNPKIAIFFGLFILWGFGWDTVGRRLRVAVDGVIVAATDVPAKGVPRYATKYTVRAADGVDQIFWAGPTDGSLPRSMPVGTRIRKERWHLDYERDGRGVGFPYVFSGVILTVGVGLVAWGLLKMLRRSR